MTAVDFRALVESTADVVAVFDRDHRYIYVNGAIERATGVRPADIVGKLNEDVMLPDDAAIWSEALEAVFAGAGPRTIECTLDTPHGRRRFASLVTSVGDLACAFTRDVTEHHAMRAATYLAEAGELLERFDPKTTLQAMTELAVPVLADRAFIHLKAAGGPITAAVAHCDPAQLAASREQVGKPRPIPDDTAIARVLAGGPAELVQVDDETLEKAAQDEGELAYLRAQGYRSVVVAPMTGRYGVLGTISFSTAESGRRFEQADLEMLAELARRTGIALDNARLYETLCAHERELIDAVQRARDADRRKDEFLAMLGHELRNPLAPIMTALDLLDMKSTAGVQKERDIIRRHVVHMSRLVDDLLDVSRITRGRLDLAKEVVELSTVIARAVEMASPLIEKKQQILVLEVPREGLLVHADPARLGQVFQNLLLNASKYSGAQTEIRIAARDTGEAIVVDVRDRGRGIAPELLPQLFEMFVQGTRTIDRAEGGLGIGLTIVRSLTELHGGSVTATSDGPGTGSTFSVTLPRAARPAQPRSERRTERMPALMRGMRVLVVDDNVDAARILHEFLAELGHEPAVAHDARSAIEIAASFKPDIAVLDIGLPVMDGYQLARELRERLGPETLRLIAMSSYGDGADQARVSDAGFDHHLVKPIALEALMILLGK